MTPNNTTPNKYTKYTKHKASDQTPLHRAAMFSIVVYIVLTLMFETSWSSMSRFASYGLYFCLVVCAIETAASGKIKIDWLTVLMFFLGAFLTVSCFYTPAMQGIVNMYIRRFWTAVVIVFLIRSVVRNERDIQTVISATVAGGVGLALFIYYEYGITYLFTMSDRLSAEHGNQNALGLYCAFAIVFSIFKIVALKRHIPLYLLAIVICLPVIMFTGSRKAILIIAASVVALFITYGSRRHLVRRVVATAAVLSVLVLVIIYVPAFSVIKERFENMFSVVNNPRVDMMEGDQNRIYYIKYGIEQFKKNPIFGNGFFSSVYYLGVYTHNNFVELLLNNGIVGLALYYIPHIVMLIRAIKIGGKDKKASSFIFMLFASLMICDIGVITYYDRFIWILIAIGVDLVSVVKKEIND